MPYYFCFRNDLIVLEANEKTQKTKYDGRSFVVGELEILMYSERSVFCICCQGGMGFVFKCVLLWRTVPFFFCVLIIDGGFFVERNLRGKRNKG